MLRRRPALIVFDLDGTLVDSAPDLAFAIDRMLTRLGRRPAGEARVRGWIGNGMPMLVQRALTGEQWPAAEPKGLAEALALYMEIYGENLSVRSRLFAGARECLERLHDEGYTLACVTNKHSRFTRPVLEHLGIADYFASLASGDQFRHHKPHPEPLLKTAETLGVEPACALMVGDSVADAEAARTAGFMLALVPYGYHGEAPVATLGADVVVQSLMEIPALCDQAGHTDSGQD
jgi:phosphoglycolate phosphatase